VREQPDEVARVDFDFGRDSTSGLNGNDRDAPRRRKTEEEDDELHESLGGSCNSSNWRGVTR
jgi:hypothetical protein